MKAETEDTKALAAEIKKILWETERLELEPDSDTEGQIIFWITGKNNGVEYKTGISIKEDTLPWVNIHPTSQKRLIEYFQEVLANHREDSK